MTELEVKEFVKAMMEKNFHTSPVEVGLRAYALGRGQGVQDFIHGRDKLCLVCGAKVPCELKDDPSSPCTFDPTPMELHKECQRLREDIEQLEAHLAELEGEA